MMNLSPNELAMLNGEEGRATRKAMEILTALGTIYGARRMIAVSSVQIAGVSFENLGEAGLEFLSEMAEGGGKTRVKTTLNPAGMDIENWRAMGISAEFAEKQTQVIEAFTRMGVIATCTCTPYLAGNLPAAGEHIAWAESSAVCYANAVLGARSNREGGPSALAAALTGVTAEYGLHLDENRKPGITIRVETPVAGTEAFGTLGKAIGERIEKLSPKPVPYVTGIEYASTEEIKSFCASIATYGGVGLFHMRGITAEAEDYAAPEETIRIGSAELDAARLSIINAGDDEIDFVSLGCPHLTLEEISRIAELLEGRIVRKTFWITTSRPVKHEADRLGYSRVIEAAGAIFATDTCCVVAPIVGRFKGLATDSAKACYYAAARNKFRTVIKPFDQVVEDALR